MKDFLKTAGHVAIIAGVVYAAYLLLYPNKRQKNLSIDVIDKNNLVQPNK